MANKFETFFEKLDAELKKLFKKAPAVAVQISSDVNYVAPFVEELDTLVDPEFAPLINPIIDAIKVGLAALATTIKDSSPSGQANVASILKSLVKNSSALQSAFKVKDPATQQKVTGILTLISAEVSAVQAQLAPAAANAAIV